MEKLSTKIKQDLRDEVLTPLKKEIETRAANLTRVKNLEAGLALANEKQESMGKKLAALVRETSEGIANGQDIAKLLKDSSLVKIEMNQNEIFLTEIETVALPAARTTLDKSLVALKAGLGEKLLELKYKVSPTLVDKNLDALIESFTAWRESVVEVLTTLDCHFMGEETIMFFMLKIDPDKEKALKILLESGRL